MLKSLIILCLMGVSLAGQGAYRYLNAGTKVSAPAAVAAPHTEYEKHFYYFSAPEDKFDQSAELQRVLQTQPKQKLQVIFIKTPENRAYERAALNLARQAVEQKTHIYVLSKQPDYAGLARHVQQVTRTHSKPEVHFVKYRTPADAERAQQSITQRYQALGGRSAHFNLGVPHVISTRSQQLPALPLSEPAQSVDTGDTGDTGSDAPVDKNYAKNFLPAGVDVVPGSSYIPLVLRR